MSATAALFLRTFVIGVAVAAPVGAMSALCVQRTLSNGWRSGAVTGLGIATADGAYAALAAFGVAGVTEALVSWQTPLRLVGGLVLIWLGLKAFASQPASRVSADASGVAGLGPTYAGTVVLTLTNPMTIMAFAAVFASASLGSMVGWRQALVATLGVALGSLGWWLALVSSASVLRHGMTEKAAHWVNRVSGALVAALGLLAMATVLWGFAR